MTPDDFATTFDVPRGTIEKLLTYERVLKEWQERMNLVAPSTLEHVWERHFADSAQLLRLAPAGASWLDIGAGGGFPGLVLAACGLGPLHLVESIAKKCAFLNAAAEAMAVTNKVVIHNARVESLPPMRAGVITARACASLKQLFDWGLRHATPATLWILPKGARYSDELSEAAAAFDFTHREVPSITSGEARIIVAENVKRKRR